MYTLGSLLVAQPCYVLATHVMNGQTGETKADRFKFKNSLRAFETIVNEQGVRGFYRGTSASCAMILCGMIATECLIRQFAREISHIVQDLSKDVENETGMARTFFKL